MIREIPLRQLPNQKLRTIINQQTIDLILYTKNNYLFCDLLIDNVIYDAGIKCNNEIIINRYYNNLKGYLFFYDINEAEPFYKNFGVTCTLNYKDK